jgi:hypothetical protein
MPFPAGVTKLIAKAELMDIDPEWRKEILEVARGRGMLNQAVLVTKASPVSVLNNLKFWSKTEVRVAEALDRAKVLFFPNCAARLTLGEDRGNREPDFLVCFEGKWGVLYVDGEPLPAADGLRA